MPCYNAAKFLPFLLESLQAQTEPADEVVVVESHSSDSTMEILKQYERALPMRIEQRPRRGIYRAWNDGLELASHSLCYIACADDVVYPEAFRYLRRLHRLSPRASIYTWPVDVIDSLGAVTVAQGSPILRVLWGKWSRVPHRRPGAADSLTALSMGSPYLSMMGVAFSRDTWISAGDFPTAYGPAGDVAWQAMAGLQGDVAFVPESLAAWRQHEQGATGLTARPAKLATARDLLGNIGPVVLSQLRLARGEDRRVLDELAAISRQTQTMTLFASIMKEKKGLMQLLPPGLEELSLAARALRIKAVNPGESLLAVPAARLRKLLLDLGLFEAEAIEGSRP